MDGIGATVGSEGDELARKSDIAAAEPAATNRRRIAFGVIQPPSRVGAAIARLRVAGVPADDMAVVAEVGSVDESYARGVVGDDEPHLLFFFHGPDGSKPWLSAEPQAEPSALGHRIFDFESWLTPELALNLNRHLKRGAVILAILMSTAGIERTVSEILLETSVDRVQLHDIA